MSVQLLLLVVISFFTATLCQVKYCEKNCPPNEVFSYNASTCQNTCFDQNIGQNRKCLVGPGCNCKNGYVRHQDTYQCIPIGSCNDKRTSKKCPMREFYSDCDAGCQKTCGSIYSNLQCQCSGGCVCRLGYFRSDINQQCLTAMECQSKIFLLIREEFFKTVASKGCPMGYVFNTNARTCVLNCTLCKGNEVYKSCSSCEKTCMNSSNGAVCTENCREGKIFLLHYEFIFSHFIIRVLLPRKLRAKSKDWWLRSAKWLLVPKVFKWEIFQV